MQLFPNNVSALTALAEALIYSGKIDQGIKEANLAIRYSPGASSRLIFLKGVAEYISGNLPSAVSLVERAIRMRNENEYYGLLAASYQEQGMTDAARSALKSYSLPIFEEDAYVASLINVVQNFPFNNKDVLVRFSAHLVAAGATDTGYFPLVSENRLSATEVRALLFGASIRGTDFWLYQEWTQHRSIDGVATHTGQQIFTGRYQDNSSVSRVVEDTLCERFSDFGEICASIFKMPQSDSYQTRRGNFVMVTDFGSSPFTLN